MSELSEASEVDPEISVSLSAKLRRKSCSGVRFCSVDMAWLFQASVKDFKAGHGLQWNILNEDNKHQLHLGNLITVLLQVL